jgi:murein L,D-transpeptidase YcbB/YkuD
VETFAVIWTVLLLAGAAVVAVLALPRRLAPRTHLPVTTPPVTAPPADGRAEQAATAARTAAEVAGRRRAAWVRAQQEVDATWAAFDLADREARRCVAAASFPILRQRRTRAELADRERHLHRTATAACRRRELSIAQLNEILAHRDGWNPRKHPVAQETALRAAVREHRFAAYRAAAERERAAWQQAEQAAATLRTLREQAVAAESRVGGDVRTGRQWAPIRPAKARLAVH